MNRRLTLRPHPDWPTRAVTTITAEAERTGAGGLELRYLVTGAIEMLLIPSFTPSVRADGLWQTSCFEAFLKVPGGEAYYELNFSPSSQWAAYRFDGYRRGMAEAPVPALAIASSFDAERFELRASLDLTALPELITERSWRLGLSAVIEEKDGGKSYWALGHPPGKADFHHKDCFAGQLHAPEAS